MPLELIAPAKLTTTLRITGVRADGLHLIDAEMVSLDLCDRMVVDPTPHEAGGGTQLEVHAADGGFAVASDPGNLVLRALAMVERHPTSVVLHKRIPAGGGLGGGSSDAAAILRWGGHDDPKTAAVLGADVAFCLRGGRARVRGFGEVVEPLAFEERTYTLALLPFGCSTPAVYAAWDRLGGPTGEHGNDLEPAALTVEPSMASWRDALGDATGEQPRLAGSGATWFVEGEFPDAGTVVRTIDVLPAQP